MFRVTIVIRGLGSQAADCCLDFDLPEVPRVGSYITLKRPGKSDVEGVQVRRVWWRMKQPEIDGAAFDGAIGRAESIFVECGPTALPCSTEEWRPSLQPPMVAGLASH